jgi:putative NIF3 family GTP cyclohydrolase 1 type 2
MQASMKLHDLAARLDREFNVAGHPENLTDFAVVDDNRALVNPSFLGRHTALMLRGNEEVQGVICVVFVTDAIVELLSARRNCLLFTHHHFDYHEDERGLEPIRSGQLDSLVGQGHSLYVAHAPLDVHPVYGTSRTLTALAGVPPEEEFFEYFGSSVGVMGRIAAVGFEEYAEKVRMAIERPCVTRVNYRGSVEKVAVVAGGGDLPEVLEEAARAGCDTLVTGTVEHRWNIPFAQDNNRRFHDLNRRLRLNLVGGTHYGTERPAMMAVTRMFREWQVPAHFMEDDSLLHAL